MGLGRGVGARRERGEGNNKRRRAYTVRRAQESENATESDEGHGR